MKGCLSVSVVRASRSGCSPNVPQPVWSSHTRLRLRESPVKWVRPAPLHRHAGAGGHVPELQSGEARLRLGHGHLPGISGAPRSESGSTTVATKQLDGLEILRARITAGGHPVAGLERRDCASRCAGAPVGALDSIGPKRERCPGSIRIRM
jgi:hypothetical protein